MFNRLENVHPDFLSLMSRYEGDNRFCKDADRLACIQLLVELNNWVAEIEKPEKIIALMLFGSFSSFGEFPPRPQPVINGPRINGKRAKKSGSDIDIMGFYKVSILDWLLLRYYRFDIPERELVHPKDYIYNTKKYFEKSLRSKPEYENIAQRAEFHIFPLMKGVATTFYPRVYKKIISTGTLLWGSAPSSECGKRRNNPPHFKRPDIDPIIEMMISGL